MPELPEVETIRKGLQKAIVGKTIAGVEVRVPKLFHGDKKEIVGKKIKNIGRRAKQIIIDIEGSNDLLIHLKMTGQLVFRPEARGKEQGVRTQIAGGHPSKIGLMICRIIRPTSFLIFLMDQNYFLTIYENLVG